MKNYLFCLKCLQAKIGLLLFILFIFSSCLSDKKDKTNTSASAEEVSSTEIKSESNQKVTIITNAMDFNGPRELNSGWNTFEYKNNSSNVHFFVVEKMPDNKTIENSMKEVVPVFQEGMDFFNDGKVQEGVEVFGKLPEWFSEVVFMGGPGLTSPGTTSNNTVFLEPGYYVYECYVKMPNGQFHSTAGMIDFFEVKNNKTNIEEPKNTIDLVISSENGFILKDSLSPGIQNFKVIFKEQQTYENFLGHDVHLVRLDENANLEKLEEWMNWTNPEGFITPSPKGVTFLGGTQELPAGETSYFSAELKPGNYAFIAEIPNSSEKGMLHKFRIE
ncbi:hypothetical protein SAMN05660776_0132 [Salegentibacter holothuriorum]|uniref:Uncharacterized protein n=1 Tax=Salegentibacter holothuriorum TaxID=241145 RepID=A0A1T5EQ74_9FLAO|nr:hypothetical protein [Salegentibacter holothuriorum]SKB85840.1 hypothetical protein SAMN05660776_0132 [Salegentibacter holothuriorum]